MQQIEPWTEELARSAEQMDRDRGAYTRKFQTELGNCLEALPDELSAKVLSIQYYRGWDSDRSLGEQLGQDLARERRYGHTLAGPHRADLRIRIGQHDASEVLSRGQLKMLVCAMKIAQGRLLLKETNRRCLFLVDDLPAELDDRNRAIICKMLAGLDCQVLFTSIARGQLEGDIKDLQSPDYKLFHVKHGTIEAT